MSGRKVRGRAKSLPQAARKKKNQHNERTNRKGKQWAKDHVAKDTFDIEKMREDRAKKRKDKHLFPFLGGKERKALEQAIEEAAERGETESQPAEQ